MNAVHGSILENLQAINIVETPTVEAFRGDKGNTGNARELTVSQFIERYLPSDFKIRERSTIYSQDSQSQNIDCVVLAPNHPQLVTPVREVALAEGVYAAVEVKPDISVLTDDSEFMRGLKQIKSIKRLARNIEQLDLSKLLKTPKQPDYFQKIPGVLFSFKSTDVEKTINFLKAKIKSGELGTEEIPDLIVTLDKGVIFYTPHLSSTAIGQQIPADKRAIAGEKAFLHFETDKKEITLAIFLLLFLNLTPPMLLTHGFIIKDYLAKMPLQYQTRFYPAELTKEAANLVVKKFFEQLTESTEADPSEKVNQ